MIDLLFFLLFILLIVIILLLKDLYYRKESLLVHIVRYVLFIPVVILNVLFFDNLNISIHLFDDDQKNKN